MSNRIDKNKKSNLKSINSKTEIKKPYKPKLIKNFKELSESNAMKSNNKYNKDFEKENKKLSSTKYNNIEKKNKKLNEKKKEEKKKLFHSVNINNDYYENKYYKDYYKDSKNNEEKKKLTRENKDKEKKEREELEKKKKEEFQKEKEKEKREKEIIEKEKEKIKKKEKEKEEEKKREEARKRKIEEEKKKEEERKRKIEEEKKKEEERKKKIEEEKKREEEKEERKKKIEEEKMKEKKEKEEKYKDNKKNENKNNKDQKEEEKDLTTTPLKSSIISYSRTKPIDSDVFAIITNKIGFRNLGNTCFMNTCLQNLVHSEYFIEELFAKKNLITSKTRISQRFYDLCTELISFKGSAYSPSDIKDEFGNKHSMFRGYRQHDTQEFCRVLLEDMNKELNEVKKPVPYKELSTTGKSKIECNKEFDSFFKKREHSLIMDVFYGQIINIFKCKCGKESYSFEKILDLPLLLKKEFRSSSIKELLDDYFGEEDDIIFETKCEGCNQKSKHSKKVKFSQPPNILILSLQRIDMRSERKINSDVSFTDELDLRDYIDKDCFNKDDAKYTLYGIGNHSGSINFGHYYAYIKINDGNWSEFNDSMVSPYSKISTSSSTAYVLFYKKINKIINN